VISVSDARKGLPRLIREIQKNPQLVFQISVRKETVAEIRSAKPMVTPGEAVKRLVRLRKRLSHSAKGKEREPISQKTKDYLYPG